jgi:SOS-response transcriptional repressor LexA
MNAPPKLPGDPRLADLLDFIIDFKEAHGGNSPSLREIIDGLVWWSSTSSASEALRWLRALGYIELHEGKSRMIEVIGAQWTAPDYEE